MKKNIEFLRDKLHFYLKNFLEAKSHGDELCKHEH